MKNLGLQYLMHAGVIISFVCISNLVLSQNKDLMCTKQEFLEVIHWDMQHTKGNSFKGSDFRILNRTQWWGNLLAFPRDSADTFDFYAALSNRVGYLDSLPNTEKQILREQFSRSKEACRIDHLLKSTNFTKNFLGGNRTTIVYCIPLIIRDRQIFVLRKDYVFNNGYMVDIEISIYKKMKEGSFHLLRSYTL